MALFIISYNTIQRNERLIGPINGLRKVENEIKRLFQKNNYLDEIRVYKAELRSDGTYDGVGYPILYQRRGNN